MASCNLSYSGHTGVIKANAYVYEQTTSGTTRRVRVILQVYSADYSGDRDGGYSVSCSQSGTNVEVPTYSGFTINGTAQTIFDETFSVSISRGSSTASMNLSFSAWLISPSAGTRKITGTITSLTLTAEPAATASAITLGASTVQMGKQLLISIDADNANCTHTLKYTFGGTTKDIATGVKISYAWTVPDLAALCNDATSGSCTITCYTYLSGSSLGTDTAGVTLTVPDPTTPSVSGGEVTLGTAAAISCKRNSANFTVVLELEFKDTTTGITSGSIDTASWTPEYDLAKQIPNLTYGTGTLKCITMNGTATVGTRTATIRVNVPENDVTRPSFTPDGLVLTPITSLSEEFAGIYMRGKTGLRAEMTASSEYSTIQSYTITVGSLSAQGNPAQFDLLVNEGDVKVTARVTDARGFTATVTTSIYIMPYRNPKVVPCTGYSDVVCERALDTGELSPRGTYLAIKAGRQFSSVVLNGEERNSCELRFRWKPNGADAFTEWVPLLTADSPQSEITLLAGSVVSSLKTSYLVEVGVVDALGGEHKLTFPIMTEAISFILYDGPDGAGFGKYPEAPHVVDIASHMTLLVLGKLEVVGSQWVNLGLADGVNESVYAYGRKEDSGCHYLVSNGNHVYAAFNCGFAYTGTPMVINAAPIPAEYRPARPVCSLCPVNDRTMALVRIDNDGYIRVEWVQQLTATVNTGSTEVIWIDGYLDYWT